MKLVRLIALAAVAAFATSCLKKDLPELPVYDEALITNVYFEFRYKDPTTTSFDGQPLVRYVRLNVAKTINTESNTVEARLTVPAASGTFTPEIRSTVSLSNLVGYCDISTAARMSPLGDSPKLGTPADFSKPREYMVVAANGSSRRWTISVVELNK